MLVADQIVIEASGRVQTNGGTVTLISQTSGQAIRLGPITDALANALELSDAELDRISSSTLTIGDANSGPITISAAITRTATTDLSLITASGNSLAMWN